MNGIELLTQNGDTVYIPVAVDDVSWELERKASPGKLVFTVVNDGILNVQEGNPVRMKWNDANIFYGFVFNKKRGKDNTVQITAYDQLRYFKNKDTYVYYNKTAAEVVRMIAADFNLQTGILENTIFKIASRKENNKTLFDIVQTALDLTLQSTGKMFVLYDDFGYLALKNVESMKLNLLIDNETAQDFDYASSIDGETYNKIKLTLENEKTGYRDVFIAQDSNNMNEWGILQYYEQIDKNINGKVKADALLSLYNKKTRTLTIKDAFGDTRVRAGTTVPVILNLGDMTVNNYMLVEKVKHTFNENQHTMDLTLRGGEFLA